MADPMIDTLTYGGRTFYDIAPADLRAQGVPDPTIAAALVGRHLGAIKAECKRRIYAQASAETQMNMNAVATAINSKAASSRTDEEKATLVAHANAVGWVKAMRDNCAVLAANAAADWLADASWPAPPADAAAFAASV